MQKKNFWWTRRIFGAKPDFFVEILTKFDDISANLVLFQKIRWKTNIYDVDSDD